MAEPQTRLRRMSSPGDGRLAGPAVGNLNDNWPNNVDRRGEWRVVDRQSHSLEHVKPFRRPTFPGPSYRESRRVPIVERRSLCARASNQCAAEWRDCCRSVGPRPARRPPRSLLRGTTVRPASGDKSLGRVLCAKVQIATEGAKRTSSRRSRGDSRSSKETQASDSGAGSWTGEHSGITS